MVGKNALGHDGDVGWDADRDASKDSPEDSPRDCLEGWILGPGPVCVGILLFNNGFVLSKG